LEGAGIVGLAAPEHGLLADFGIAIGLAAACLCAGAGLAVPRAYCEAPQIKPTTIMARPRIRAAFE